MDPFEQPRPDSHDDRHSGSGGAMTVAARDSAPAADNLTAIVHELRDLLDGATRCLQSAREDSDKADQGPSESHADLLGKLEAAELALDRMSRVIQLAMSPAAAPLLERFTEPCPLIEALMHAMDVHAPIAQTKRITINIDCSPRLVLTPAGPLYTVLASVIRNAVDAMNEGGEIEIIAELVTPSRGGPEVHIDILDTGPGPDLDASEHAFELGFTTKTCGIGVGLALSQEIIEELGGWMALRKRAAKSCGSGQGGAHLMIRYPALA
jgi:signal transduction histidine kinase